ncbi:MAG TPA: hypothetical protein VG734_21860 [Lacunisphaera sp.]|nr:hypothetical protein [Lacunisphaera sp.]
MRIPRLCLLAFLGAGVVGIASPAAAKDLEVINFVSMYRNPDDTYEKAYEYTFGDWQNKNVVQLPGKGLVVNLVGSKGGVGENRGLDFRKHTKARVTFMVGNRNKALSFQFSLVDKDGTDQSFDVPLDNRPAGVEQTHTLDLTKPSREEKPGSTPGLNLKKLKSWQIKGSFQAEPSELLFLRVDAVE